MGRATLAVTSGGKTSNVTEIVILPNVGQGAFPNGNHDDDPSRKISSIAWVPGTSLALITDENDDVVRVLDVKRKQVVRTIQLPAGSDPADVAVNSAGTLAVVAERDLGKAAIIDLIANRVLAQLMVGGGPSNVAIAGNLAIVVNQDTDSVSILNLLTRTVVVTIPVGRGPRSVAVDTLANRAYVTNQNDGTVSVINLSMTPTALISNIGIFHDNYTQFGKSLGNDFSFFVVNHRQNFWPGFK